MTGSSELLRVQGLSLDAPGGRPLFRGLTARLGRGERVAVVGRNGAGKSSLLEALSGGRPRERGRVECRGQIRLVPQRLEATWGSPGEVRRSLLERAIAARPDLLLLDEPSLDLDVGAVDWLRGALRRFDGAVVMVSHDRRLLDGFEDFFIVSEVGCSHFHGSLGGLTAHLEQQRDEEQRRYVQGLTRLAATERRDEALGRRRQRKKNLGRARELGRCPSRAALNGNRGYAQESQGRRAVLQRRRLSAARDFARAARRALAVQLPLSAALPEPVLAESPVASLERVTVERDGHLLCEGLTIGVGRDRVALTGPNGVGKTTLLEVLVGARAPVAGRAHCEPARLGHVAQNADNFCRDESLLEELLSGGDDVDGVAAVLAAHRFPFALAERPLRSLSPGERLRAALICLCQRRPTPELLVLDEPSAHLDFLGAADLERVLSAWRGGLVVASHDEALLSELRIERRLALG